MTDLVFTSNLGLRQEKSSCNIRILADLYTKDPAEIRGSDLEPSILHNCTLTPHDVNSSWAAVLEISFCFAYSFHAYFHY